MSIDYTVETKSLARQIADSIREAIVSGQLQADDRLPTEPELAERYGVSRPTIREALKRLAAQKLVRSRRGPAGGTFIRRIESKDLADGLSTNFMLMVGMGEISLDQVAESRAGLEGLCAELAANNIEDRHLAALEQELAEQADPATSDECFCASDVRFHKTIASATGNPILEITMTAVLDALQPATNLIVYRLRDRNEVIRQHQLIIEALRQGDVEAATQAISTQMEALKELYGKAQTGN